MAPESEESGQADPDSDVRCPLCNASLVDEDELKLHMEGHDEQAAEGNPVTEPPQHACPLCSASFPTPEELKEHLGSRHGK